MKKRKERKKNKLQDLSPSKILFILVFAPALLVGQMFKNQKHQKDFMVVSMIFYIFFYVYLFIEVFY